MQDFLLCIYSQTLKTPIGKIYVRILTDSRGEVIFLACDREGKVLAITGPSHWIFKVHDLD